MTFCKGIKADGHKCDKRALVGQERCRTHANVVVRIGPNNTAVKELKYVHSRELQELAAEWNTRIEAEPDEVKRRDLLHDYQHATQIKKADQRHAVELLERFHRDEVRRTGVDPDREAVIRRNQELLRRQEEHQRRIEARMVLMEQMRIQQEVNRGELARFAADNQNVHTTQTVNITKQIVERILKIPVPNDYKWDARQCSKTPGDIIMSCKLSSKAAWQMTAKYCQDESIYGMEEGIYGKTLDGVWQYILNSTDKEDLCRCVKQEMEDNIGMCAQGNLSRLCNILAGYLEGVGSQECLADILGREFSKLMEIENLQERLTKALSILKENNVPILDWEKWLDPLTYDQDVEMKVGFIRNSNDEITGFLAVEV
jgi:hypothetical protein